MYLRHEQILFSNKEIMAYFALRCFSPDIGKYIIIGLNVIVAILGVTHWGFAGLYGAIRSYYVKIGISGQSASKLYDSAIGYFAISGIFQVSVSALAILMLLGILGKENKICWARLLIILLVLEFAFDFFIAVYTSMMSSYFNTSFKNQLDYTMDFIDSIGDANLRDFTRSIRDLVRYCTAEAVITWVISIPAVAIIILGLTDQLLNENTVEEMGKLILVSVHAIPPGSIAVIQPMNDSFQQPKQPKAQ